MPSVETVKAYNQAHTFSYIPTAVFVGGTSGIGQAMAQLLATYTNGRANIIIVGRNKATAERIIASFPKPPSPAETGGVTVKHEFIQCDASLMSNVRTTVEEIKKRHDKINILVCTIGYLAVASIITSEGLDESVALRAYARDKFIYELQPLLSKAKAAGEDARAMTILAAAYNRQVNLEDMDVKTFSMMNANAAAASYNDVFVKVSSTLVVAWSNRLTSDIGHGRTPPRSVICAHLSWIRRHPRTPYDLVFQSSGHSHQTITSYTRGCRFFDALSDASPRL